MKLKSVSFLQAIKFRQNQIVAVQADSDTEIKFESGLVHISHTTDKVIVSLANIKYMNPLESVDTKRIDEERQQKELERAKRLAEEIIEQRKAEAELKAKVEQELEEEARRQDEIELSKMTNEQMSKKLDENEQKLADRNKTKKETKAVSKAKASMPKMTKEEEQILQKMQAEARFAEMKAKGMIKSEVVKDNFVEAKEE